MSSKLVVRSAAVAALAMAIAVFVYHQSRDSVEGRTFAFMGLQVLLAAGLFWRVVLTRWIAAIFWFVQGVFSLSFALSSKWLLGSSEWMWISSTFGVICVSCTLLLLTPAASTYFAKKAF